MFIHERDNWTDFSWDAAAVMAKATEVYRTIGFLSGRLSAVGFDDIQTASAESLAQSIVASSVIEGVALDMDEVRSSVARKLGINIPNEKEPTHYVEGYIFDILAYFREYSDFFTRRATIRRLEQNKAQLEKNLAKCNDTKDIEACSKRIAQTDKDMTRAREVASTVFNILFCYEDGAMFLEVGTVENCLHDLFCRIDGFMAHLDCVCWNVG